jgi:hypothetical protein
MPDAMNINKPMAVLDANVLFPVPLVDFLMWLFIAQGYQSHWTDEIHDQWRKYNVCQD